MRRDRDGEVLENDEDDDVHRCDAGWAGYDADGRPSPCPRCRPHLRRSGTRNGPRWTVQRADLVTGHEEVRRAV